MREYSILGGNKKLIFIDIARLRWQDCTQSLAFTSLLHVVEREMVCVFLYHCWKLGKYACVSFFLYIKLNQDEIQNNSNFQISKMEDTRQRQQFTYLTQ